MHARLTSAIKFHLLTYASSGGQSTGRGPLLPAFRGPCLRVHAHFPHSMSLFLRLIHDNDSRQVVHTHILYYYAVGAAEVRALWRRTNLLIV